MPLSDFIDRVDATVKRDDIRGVYAENIDRDFAYNLGLALADVLLDCTAVHPVNVVVGHDMRLSGPVLAQALCEGLDDGGCRSILMGRAGTELVGFLPAKYGDVIDAGVMITASHNPKDNNGFKFFGRHGMPLPLLAETEPPEPEGALQRMATSIKKRSLPTRLSWSDFAPDYIRTALDKGGCEFAAAVEGASEPLRVAVEAGNGMGAQILKEFAGLTPQFVWSYQNDVPDGGFPVIMPNPLMADYQAMVRDLVLRTGSHVGICSDGDADRVSVADETGRMLSPPLLTALVGRRLREKLGPNEKVAFNLASSWVVPDTLGERDSVLGDGAAVMTPVGYGKIKVIMYDDPQIAFGAEHSGHYMFRDFWCADSGLLAGLLMLELVAELHAEGRTLSSILEEPRAQYIESGEINFPLPADVAGEDVIPDATRRFADEIERLYVVVDDRCRVVDAYPPEGLELSVADVRAEAANWWFCMRKSGTEGGGGGILRLYVEADRDASLLAEKRDALVDLVKSHLPG